MNLASEPKPLRHRWGDPVRFQYKTERICLICGMVKVTRHEPGVTPWIEFWAEGEKIKGEGTPGCS